MNLPRIKTELILESWGNIAVTKRFRERTFRSEQNTKQTFFNEMLADMTDETKTALVYDSHRNTKNLPACILTWSKQRIHKIFYTLRKLYCDTEQLGSEFSRSRMNFFNIIFCLLCFSLIFQTLSGVNSKSKQVTSNKTPNTSTTSKCHNVHFNNYYSGSASKDIKVHLLKIENQLADLEKKIDALTENKTTLPGEFLSILYIRLTTRPC